MNAIAPAVQRPLRACVLIRKSNKPGEDNCSLEVQRTSAIQLIGQNGWVFDPVTDLVTQVVSGWQKKDNRTKIAALVNRTLAGQYDVIVVYKVDRFGRRVPEVTAYFEDMAEHGVQLASVVEGRTFDLANNGDLTFVTHLVVQAQHESGNTSTRVRGTRAHRRDQGHWQGGVPYGWEIDCETAKSGDRIFNRAQNGSKRLRRKSGEAAIVDRILLLARERMLSAGAIAKILNGEGVPSPRSVAWTDKQVRRLLVNPVLAGGVAEWDYDPKTGRTVAWSVHPLLTALGVPVEVHQPAVSWEEYQLLYARFGPRNVSTRDRSGRALLTGLLTCASHPAGQDGPSCGGRLTGSSNPETKHKYHCPHHDDPRRCRGNTVTQLPLEGYVVALFINLVSAGDFARRHRELVAAAIGRSDDAGVQVQQQIHQLTELAEAHRQASEVARTPQAILAASQNYDQTMARIEELRRQQAGRAAVAPGTITEFVHLDAEACGHVFAAANRDQQRRWLATVIDRIELLPASGRGATKGAFGSRGFDPRRVRIYLRHAPDAPIVAPADWQGTAPDFGGPSACPDCKHECKNKAALAAHRRWAHGRVSKAKQQRGERAEQFRCHQPGCDKVLYNAAALRNHLWHEHKVTDGYTCPEAGCDRTFALPAGVGRHLATIHSPKLEFCDLCGGSFKPGGLWLHRRRAHGA